MRSRSEHPAKPDQGKSASALPSNPRRSDVGWVSFACRKVSVCVGKCRFPCPPSSLYFLPNPRPLHHLRPPPLPDTPSHAFFLSPLSPPSLFPWRPWLHGGQPPLLSSS